MTLVNSIAAMTEEITASRRDLHRHPQIAYEETFASDLIAKKLTDWGIAFDRGLAVTGIVATIEGNTNTKGRAIGLRCDMDALPMTETSGQLWSSTIPNRMHGCGHDGHTAMLLGAAKYLSETRNFDGKVHLIFQPAEEGGAGAIRMIAEGLFDRFPMDAVFGMHNWPGLPMSVIGLRSGPIMASSDSFEVTLTGRGGHAAMPNLSIDPIVAGAHIVTALQSVVSREIDPVDQAVLSVTNFNAGSGATNVIPETARITGTFRAFRVETRAHIHRRIEEIVRGIGQTLNVAVEVRVNDGYDPTINSAAETAFCETVARGLVGDANVEIVAPCMGAEDFGAMLQKVPGCYIWMGQGRPDLPDSPHNKGLHNTGYDFNDAIIPLGIEYWARVAEGYLAADSRKK